MLNKNRVDVLTDSLYRHSAVSILEYALELHQYNTGSSDTLALGARHWKVYKFLESVLDDWTECNNMSTKMFDESVKNVVQSVICEYIATQHRIQY